MLKRSMFKIAVLSSIISVAACSNDADAPKKSDSQSQETKAQTAQNKDAQPQASSDWTIVTEKSQLNFSSTKNGDVTEKHSFKNFSGTVKNTGEVEFTIDLTSVDTNIPIRDERLQKHVFNTSSNSKATIKTDIDPALLAVSDNATAPVVATLELAGNNYEIMTDLNVTAKNNTLVVTTAEPIVLSVKDLGVKAGIDKLQEIAGLQSISDEVPVTFSFTLQPKK